MIRAATEKDVHRINESMIFIMNESVPLSEGDLQNNDRFDENIPFLCDVINAQDGIILLSETDNDISGCLIAYGKLIPEGCPFYRKRNILEIEQLFVMPAYRKRGIAKALLERVEQWGKENGFDEIALEVYKNNKHAKKLYDSSGYAVAKEKRNKRLH